MTSSNGNIFRATGLLLGEFTGNPWIPLTKTSGAELWYFLWSAPAQTVEQTIETPMIWEAIALKLWGHRGVSYGDLGVFTDRLCLHMLTKMILCQQYSRHYFRTKYCFSKFQCNVLPIAIQNWQKIAARWTNPCGSWLAISWKSWHHHLSGISSNDLAYWMQWLLYLCSDFAAKKINVNGNRKKSKMFKSRHKFVTILVSLSFSNTKCPSGTLALLHRSKYCLCSNVQTNHF